MHSSIAHSNMSTRVPLQMISNNNRVTPQWSSAGSYDPSYYQCCYYEDPSAWMMDEYSPSMQPVQMDCKKRSSRRSKHVPHHLRPVHLVERRNTRERRRVHDVNQAFHTLQTLLPANENAISEEDQAANAARLSKAQTLRAAADYIAALQELLYGNH